MTPAPVDLIEPGSGQAPPGLRGSRCTNCGEVVFPALRDCPLCRQRDVMEPHALRGHGLVKDYVVAERGPVGFVVPYVQAYVKLDDGPVIYSSLVVGDLEGDQLAIGEPVTMTVGPVGSPHSELVGWQFVPDRLRRG